MDFVSFFFLILSSVSLVMSIVSKGDKLIIFRDNKDGKAVRSFIENELKDQGVAVKVLSQRWLLYGVAKVPENFSSSSLSDPEHFIEGIFDVSSDEDMMSKILKSEKRMEGKTSGQFIITFKSGTSEQTINEFFESRLQPLGSQKLNFFPSFLMMMVSIPAGFSLEAQLKEQGFDPNGIIEAIEADRIIPPPGDFEHLQ